MALAPSVQRLVDPLLATGRYAIEELEAGDAGKGALLDRFRLVVQYCAGALRWYVVFNAAQPAAPPDVILGDDDEEWAEAMWMDSAPPLHPAQWRGGADPTVLLTAMDSLLIIASRVAACARSSFSTVIFSSSAIFDKTKVSFNRACP